MLNAWYRIKSKRGFEDPQNDKKRKIVISKPTTAGFLKVAEWGNRFAAENHFPGGFEVVNEDTGSKNEGKYLVDGTLFFGKEESGHEVHPESFDDAVWQFLFVLNMMGETGKTLEELLQECQKEIGFE